MVIKSEVLLQDRYQLSVVESKSPSHIITEDIWFCSEVEDCVRLGIIDGVTSTPRTPWLGRAKGGRAAAILAADSLLASPLRASAAMLDQVNQGVLSLRDGEEKYTRDHPQAAWGFVEVCGSQVSAWVGADIEVWVKTPYSWLRLCDHDMVSPDFRTPLLKLQQKVELKQNNFAAWIDQEAELLDSEAAWVSTSFGRFETLKFVSEDYTGDWDQIVVASDGACLSSKAMLELDNHIPSVIARYSRDDLSIMTMRHLPL